MIASINKNNKPRASFFVAVLGAIWLNFVLLPCVHAASIDNANTHNCPHCPIPQKDSCHDNSTCEETQNGVATLKVQKDNDELDKYRINFTAFNPKLAHEYTISSQLSETTLQSCRYNYPIPIYLKNCAFLN